MIDLSLMNSVQVNPAAQTAVAQGGAKWGAFDTEAERYQLATTGGVISSTGVCGLTLGGGIGWLMGKHGLSCDNVISADMVSADGSHLSVSATENEDLFWAIRGGGGNFGIVTALELRLHPLKSVQAGLLLYPFSSAFDLLRRYRDVTAPDELTGYAALMTGHGNPMAAIAMCDSASHRGSSNVSSQFSLPNPPVADNGHSGQVAFGSAFKFRPTYSSTGSEHSSRCSEAHLFGAEFSDFHVSKEDSVEPRCDQLDTQLFEAEYFADEDPVLVPADVAAIVDSSQQETPCVPELWQLAGQSDRTGDIETCGDLIVQALVRTLVIEHIAKVIESALLCAKGCRRRFCRVLLQCAVHPLMAAVLLRSTCLNALMRDPELHPAEREL